MKRVFLAMVIALISMSAMAQSQGDKALGFNVSYGTDIKNVGVGVKGQYMFTENVRAEASFDYFFEKDDTNMWDINANFHYLVPVADKVRFYPLVGLGIVSFYDSLTDATVKLCLNAGGGIQYKLADDLAIGAEAKYQIINRHNQLVVGIGVALDL
ncbi:MAG: porin family protein [Prevotella sp.]|jgi:outer membrane protein X|nr:porin family protein [Prevotella sp.]